MQNKIKVGLGVFAYSVSSFATAMNSYADVSVMSVNSLQNEINAKKAGWVAKENWVTRLLRPEIKRMMGAQEAPDPSAEFSIRQSTSEKQLLGLDGRQTLPAVVDWRNKDGVNWVSPVLNQGNCGSCVAFSTVATLETQMNISSGIPGLNAQFSTQALFACGGGACDFGWQPGLAAKYLKTDGIPDEACAPYSSGATGQDVDCSATCSDRAARSLKIVDYTQPSRDTTWMTAVKTALLKGPLTTTLTVYDDFLFYSGGVYKHVSGGAAGGHAVSLVGYNDNDRAWIVRNSWGADWGENGFVRVSYDDVSGIARQTWGYQLPKQDGYVTLYSPHNRNFVSGVSRVSAESTFPNTQKVDVSITDVTGRSAYGSSCDLSGGQKSCSLDLDTTKLADGIYDAIAIAHFNGRTEASQHEIFYVVNSKPTMPLSITAMNDESGSPTDSSKALSGRVVFNLATNSSPVPYSTLTFHVTQNGKDVYSKVASIVVQQGMTLGWRTGSVPNGTYEIYFTGTISPEGKQTYSTESPHMQVSVKN